MRESAFPQEPDLFATPHGLTIFSVHLAHRVDIRSTSRSRSVNRRFSFAFSSSRALNRFTSTGASPAKCLRHR